MDGAKNKIKFILSMIQKSHNLEGIHKDTLDFKQKLTEIEYLKLRSLNK